jgi:hypothetical protein
MLILDHALPASLVTGAICTVSLQQGTLKPPTIMNTTGIVSDSVHEERLDQRLHHSTLIVIRPINKVIQRKGMSGVFYFSEI